MIMIKGDLVYGFSQAGTKEFAALTILRVLHCNALQHNTLSTLLLHDIELRYKLPHAQLHNALHYSIEQHITLSVKLHSLLGAVGS